MLATGVLGSGLLVNTLSNPNVWLETLFFFVLKLSYAIHSSRIGIKIRKTTHTKLAAPGYGHSPPPSYHHKIGQICHHNPVHQYIVINVLNGECCDSMAHLKPLAITVWELTASKKVIVSITVAASTSGRANKINFMKVRTMSRNTMAFSPTRGIIES
jgi:hypothetical protein